MSTRSNKSWREKLADDKGCPKICEVTGKMNRRRGSGRFVIPAPQRVTPYWRTLKSGGEINPKYPGSVGEISPRLRVEGHGVVQKGKNFSCRILKMRCSPD